MHLLINSLNIKYKMRFMFCRPQQTGGRGERHLRGVSGEEQHAVQPGGSGPLLSTKLAQK